MTALAAADAPVPVPSQGSFGFAVDDGGDRRVLAFTAAEVPQLPQPLRLRLWPPTVVRARCVDAAGRPVAVRAALLPLRDCLHGEVPFAPLQFAGVGVADGALALPCRDAGVRVLAVRPRYPELQPRLRPLLLPVALPHRGADVQVDLGRLQLADAPRLRVVDAAGRPWRGRPGWTRTGFGDVRQRPPSFPLDADGGWLGIELLAGDAITVPAADWELEPEADAGGEPAVDLPFRSVLQGQGPWTIAVPGELQLEVVDELGQPLPATLFVADRSVAVAGRVRLRQLPPGRLELLLAAEDRQPAEATAVVPAQGAVTLRVPLPRR